MNHPEPVTGLLGGGQARRCCGAAVLAARNGDALDVSNKGDAGDWVTAFDVAAENAVRDAITAARPQDTITGEEHGTTRPDGTQRLPLVHRPAGRHHQLHPQHRLLRHLRGSGGFRRRLAGRRRQRTCAGPHLLRCPRTRAHGWRKAAG